MLVPLCKTKRLHVYRQSKGKGKGKGKGKAVPLQAWTGPVVSRKLRLPRFRDNGTGWW